MLTIAAAETIGAVADTTNVITMTMFGMELNAGVESYKTLYQGRITNSVATKYTAPSATEAFVKSIHLANTSASEVTGVILYLNGATNSTKLATLSIPANGLAVLGEDGWRMYNASGELQVRLSNIPNTDGFIYQFDSGTTITNPGLTEFSFNNATLTSATKMCLSYFSNDGSAGSNMTALIESLMNGKSAILLISNLLRDGLLTVIVHRVVADNSSWYELDVTVIGNTLAPVTGTNYYLQILSSQAGWAGRVTNTKLDYLWSTTTTSGPAAGTARLSTTTPHSASDAQTLYLALTDANGNDQSEFFNTLKTAGSTRRTQLFITVTTPDGLGNASHRFKVTGGITVTSAGLSCGVNEMTPNNSMPSNAAAVDVIFEQTSNSNAEQQGPSTMIAGTGLYGAPGYTVGGVITNYAWGTAARVRCIPICVTRPIMLIQAHMICSLISSGASAAKFGYSKIRPLGRSGTPAAFRIGEPISHVTFNANVFGSTGLKTLNLNYDILAPGYYMIYMAVQAIAQNAQCHALLTNSNDNINFNGSVNPMLFTSEFAIAVDHSGGGPLEGATLTTVTAGASASFEQNFQMPFWISWLPVD